MKTHAIIIIEKKDFLRSITDNQPILFDSFDDAYQWTDRGEKVVPIEKLPAKLKKQLNQLCISIRSLSTHSFTRHGILAVKKHTIMTQAQKILHQNITSKGKALKAFPETIKLNALRYKLAEQCIYNVTKAR